MQQKGFRQFGELMVIIRDWDECMPQDDYTNSVWNYEQMPNVRVFRLVLAFTGVPFQNDLKRPSELVVSGRLNPATTKSAPQQPDTDEERRNVIRYHIQKVFKAINMYFLPFPVKQMAQLKSRVFQTKALTPDFTNKFSEFTYDLLERIRTPKAADNGMGIVWNFGRRRKMVFSGVLVDSFDSIEINDGFQ